MGGLLWFFIGAGAASVYTRRHNHLEHEGTAHKCHQHSQTSSPAQVLAQPPSTQRESFFPGTPWSNHSASSPSSSPDTSRSSPTDPWATEKERLREIGNQVGVNVLEFSESTLDTLSANIASMKARVVQQRLDREKQEKLKAQEQQRPDPPRYV